jgi:hypothetical protein
MRISPSLMPSASAPPTRACFSIGRLSWRGKVDKRTRAPFCPFFLRASHLAQRHAHEGRASKNKGRRITAQRATEEEEEQQHMKPTEEEVVKGQQVKEKEVKEKMYKVFILILRHK